MEVSDKQHTTSVKFVFSLILLLGIGVSTLVFVHGEKITDITLDLVEKQIPTFELFQHFHASLVEQERYLYEYYATEQEQLFSNGYANAKQNTKQTLAAMFEIFGDHPKLLETQSLIKNLETTADNYQINISSRQTNWDLARDHLAQISMLRRQILPYTDDLQSIAERSVNTAQNEISEQSLLVRSFVIVYGLVTLLIAFIVARTSISALANAAISQRLALFPKRNPNPVISLDVNNQVTFANPATQSMLRKLGQSQSDVAYLLAPTLEQEQHKVLQGENSAARFEYNIDNLILDCEVHWLADQHEWDLHITDITAQKEAERSLQHQAFHHPETGLSNRYELHHHLDNHCFNGKHVSIAIMQLSEYNHLISSRGHTAAQKIINQLAESIQRIALTVIDSQLKVYHAGDDHFVFVCSGETAEKCLTSFIYEIELFVASSVFHSHHQPDLKFGIVHFPDHGKDADSLMRNAWTALESIEPFQDLNYFVYDEKIGKAVQREQQMINDIRTAITNENFTLHFQPQVDIVSNRVIGAEVLVRWQTEDGWISPGEFIPLAEKSGLIVSLGEWILRTACSKAAELCKMGYEDLVVAVNISPRQFGRTDFIDIVTPKSGDPACG